MPTLLDALTAVFYVSLVLGILATSAAGAFARKSWVWLSILDAFAILSVTIAGIAALTLLYLLVTIPV